MEPLSVNEAETIRERLKRARIAAAEAIEEEREACLQNPNLAFDLAFEAAKEAGSSPTEATSIAVEFRRTLHAEADIGSGPRLRSSVALKTALPLGGVAKTDKDSKADDELDIRQLYKKLSQLVDWESLASLSGELNLPSEDALTKKLEEMKKDGFVDIQNKHVYVTGLGHKFLDYSKLA